MEKEYKATGQQFKGDIRIPTEAYAYIELKNVEGSVEEIIRLYLNTQFKYQEAKKQFEKDLPPF